MPRYKLEQLQRTIMDSCIQTMRGGPPTREQEEATSYCNLGWSAYKRGDIEVCIADSKKALQLYPDLGVAQANLGLCYLIKGDPSTAMQYYVEAIASYKKDHLTRTRHLKAEIDDIDQALKTHPSMSGYKDIRDLLLSNLPR